MSEPLYGFTLAFTPEQGWRFVKQLHRNGTTLVLGPSSQSAYRFGSYQEAISAGEVWATGNGLAWHLANRHRKAA